MKAKKKRWFNSIKSKLLLIFSSLILFSLATSLVSTDILVQNFGQSSTQEALLRNVQTSNTLIESIENTLKTQTELVGVLPTLVTVVENGDEATVFASAKSYQEQLNLSIFDILDADEELLVSVADNFSLDGSPETEHLISHIMEEGKVELSLTLRDEQLALLTSGPIGLADEPSGVLIIGTFLDNAFANKIKELTEADITFVAKNKILSSSLPEEDHAMLLETLPQLIPESIVDPAETIANEEAIEPSDAQETAEQEVPLQAEQAKPVFIESENYIFTVQTLKNVHGTPIAHMLVQGSLEGSSQLIFQIRMFLIVIGSIVLLVSIFSAYLITNTITSPLTKVMEMLQALNSGNLRDRLQMGRTDEIGQMADAVDTFADRLELEILTAFEKLAEGDFTFETQGVIKEPLRRTNQSLNVIVANINGVGEHLSKNSVEVSFSSASLSQGASEQAATLEEITASLSDLSEQIALTAANTKRAHEIANIAHVSAEAGNASMKEMLQAMDQIEGSSSNISDIIKSIDEIAFQTNLLALNAAVEAARAGQHGKGFAVVAQEVRNLAQRSSEAAQETTSLIEQSVEKVHHGSAIAQKTAKSLAEIVKSETQENSLITEIADASERQSEGIRQIREGLERVNQVTQQNSEVANSIASASKALSNQAADLKHMVARFKLYSGSHQLLP